MSNCQNSTAAAARRSCTAVSTWRGLHAIMTVMPSCPSGSATQAVDILKKNGRFLMSENKCQLFYFLPSPFLLADVEWLGDNNVNVALHW